MIIIIPLLKALLKTGRLSYVSFSSPFNFLKEKGGMLSHLLRIDGLSIIH